MSDSSHLHPPTPRPEDEALEPRPPDLAAWAPLTADTVAPPGEAEVRDALAPGGEAEEVTPTPSALPGQLPHEPPGSEAHVLLEDSWAPLRHADSAHDAQAEARKVRGLRQAAARMGPSGARPVLPGRPTAPLDLPLPLLVLTEQARRVPEAERPELALRLNSLLGQMAAEGGDRQVADTFHRLLDSGKLEGLVDTRGRSCRAAAVEALLSLGFPYALEVRPEDLEHLRADGRREAGRTGFGLGPVVPSAVLLTGLVAQVVQELSRAGGPDSLVTTQVGLSALALMALWLAPPKSAVYRVGLGLLALVTCLGLVGPLLGTGPVGVWAVLAGLVAAFLAALRES